MITSDQFANVFCIPHDNNYVIYFPLKKVVLYGNDVLAHLIYRARLGDQEALDKLNINQEFVSNLFDSSEQMNKYNNQNRPPQYAPTTISLFLTNDCTLQCKYCYANGGEDNRQMPWEIITGVLEEIVANVRTSKLKRMNVNFHGGGDISAAWRLVVRTKEFLDSLLSSTDIKLSTSAGLNGILNPQQREWIIHNIDSATVSIDGTPDIQNDQRPFPDGTPSFEYVDETLNIFDKAHYPYSIRTTVTSRNVDALEEIMTFFCTRYKAQKMKFEPMFPQGRGFLSVLQPPDAVTFVKEFRKARSVAKRYRRDLLYSGARLEVLTNKFCQAAGDSCSITPEGYMTSCYEVLNISHPLSKIFFYGRFNPSTRKMEIDEERRKGLFQLDVLSKPFCEKCYCKWHCAGDCPVKSLQTMNNPDQIYPDRCYINRELTKDQLVEALNS